MKRSGTWMVRRGLLIINSLSIMGIAVFIHLTTGRIVRNYQARDFLNTVDAIPQNTNQLLDRLIFLLLVIFINFEIREYAKTTNHKLQLFSLSIDFICSFLIIYFMNFNYNGILLFVFSNVILYVKGGLPRFAMMALAVLSYLLADYELLSIYTPLYSVTDYIQYYDAGVQQYLLSGYNILVSINIIAFIWYCLVVITEQKGTIDEVSSLYEELEDVNQQLQEYSVMAEKMAETRERNRLAREIHDTLGHTLTGISAGLDACVATIDVAPETTKKQLEVLSKVSRDGLKEIRRSVSELRPDALERFSLEGAINKMVSDMNAMSEAQIQFECTEKLLKFDEDEEMAIYRVIQEGITNALRHGKATCVWVRLTREDADIVLTIRDNGIGCNKEISGFGTKHMKERIAMLKGNISFEGKYGFTVIARIPIRWGENYD